MEPRFLTTYLDYEDNRDHNDWRGCGECSKRCYWCLKAIGSELRLEISLPKGQKRQGWTQVARNALVPIKPHLTLLFDHLLRSSSSRSPYCTFTIRNKFSSIESLAPWMIGIQPKRLLKPLKPENPTYLELYTLLSYYCAFSFHDSGLRRDEPNVTKMSVICAVVLDVWGAQRHELVRRVETSFPSPFPYFNIPINFQPCWSQDIFKF